MAGRDLFAQESTAGRNLFAGNQAQLPAEPTPPPQEEPGFIDKAVGVGEAALSIGSSMVAEPVAGLAGIAQGLNPYAEEGAGAKAIDSVRKAWTFQPRGDEGKEYIQDIGETLNPIDKAMKSAEEYLGDEMMDLTGSPLLAAAAATIPTAVLELIGSVGVLKLRGEKQVDGITDEAVDALAEKGLDIDDISDSGIEKLKEKSKADVKERIEEAKEPEDKSYKSILRNIENKKLKKSTEAVMPDSEIMVAAKELGVELNPSHYSTNKAYIDIEQSLKSKPGSMLSAKELKAIDDLGAKADETITTLGGSIDKSLFDIKVKNEISATIDDLSKKASTAYNSVSNAIPPNTIITAPKSKEFMAGIVDDLGDNLELMTSAEKQLYNLVKKDTVTYGAIDRLRKDIGKGFKGKGIYKDDNSGALKRVYAAISDDQQQVSKAFKVDGEYSVGRKLVSDRKKIENNMISLFGKEANKSIVPIMKSSATGLTKGDASKFSKLMNALPENLRQEAAVIMLGDLFVQDARSTTGISQGFVKAFEGLNRNKAAKKILFDALPKDARKRFNNIGKVATGLYKAKALENTSKTARDLIQAMDSGGLFKKITDVGGKVAVAEGASSSVGLPGVGAAGVIGSILTKSRKASSIAADEFITSDIFIKSVKEAAEGNVKNANEKIAKSKAFKKWIKFANKGDAEAIAAVGFIPWVTGQEGVENEQ